MENEHLNTSTKDVNLDQGLTEKPDAEQKKEAAEEFLNSDQTSFDTPTKTSEESKSPEMMQQEQEQEEEHDELKIINELKYELNKAKDDLLRERAEFINYRKRVVQEKSDMEDSITAKIVHAILPVFDAFDQFLLSVIDEGEQSMENFIKGAELIQKQLVSAFQKYGLEEFNPKDEPFDPGSMEALHSQESNEVSSEIVHQVYQKGYKINDRLIRAARVAVLKPSHSGQD